MVSSASEIERSLKSLNRMIPKRPFDHVGEETIVKIQVRLRELESSEPPAPETDSADRQKLSDSPRLYTFLRVLSYGHEEVIAAIRKAKINDYSIPLDPIALKQLRGCLDQDIFEDVQASFLSDDSRMKAENLTGSQPEHRRLEEGTLFLEDIKALGQGSSAMVYSVRHRVSKSEFACKRIERGPVRSQPEKLQDFLREMKVLQRLNHRHIVKLIASYTDAATFSLILLPVANDTLESLLKHMSSTSYQADASATIDFAWGASILRHAFGCLLSTLVYLQDKNVRHKDIKPLNILLSSEGRVYLCDFGISLDYSSTKEATTEGRSIGFTPGYCAPEVESGESRNTLSEVWSLGRVFFDMIVVLRGRPIQHAKDFIGLDAEKIGFLIRKYLAPLLIEPDKNCDNTLIEHTLRMTAYHKAERPEAIQVLQAAPFNVSWQSSHHSYIGPCCSRTNSRRSSNQKEKLPLMYGRTSSLISDQSADVDLAESKSHPVVRLSVATIDHETLNEMLEDEPIRRGHSRTDPTDQSNGSISAQSEQQRSSGSIEVPSSLSSSPPDGPTSVSASPSVGCLCVARSIESGLTGLRILSVPFTSITWISPQRSIETDNECTSLDNSVHIFESYLKGTRTTSGIWTKTRRLVISYKSSHLDMRICKSLWLPLADIQYACQGTQVILRWSDCDQIEEQRLGDSNLIYSRIYQSTKPNNEVNIMFNDAMSAQEFIYVVTHAESDTAIPWRRLGTPHTQELRVFRVQKMPNHYVLHVSKLNGSYVQSKLFIQQTDSILDIWTHPLASTAERALSVRFCGRVSTPNYYSDVIDKPSDDESLIAKCSKAILVFGEYQLDFALASNTDNAGLPTNLQEILAFLTNWTIRFLASGVKVSVPGVFKRDYGYADVILWEPNRGAYTGSVRGSVLAFRQSGPKKDYLWRTGIITANSQAAYKSPDAEVTIFRKSCGDLLDTTSMATTMEADLPQNKKSDTDQHSRKRNTGKQKKPHENDTLRLHFASHEDYTRFFACFNELLETAKVDAQLKTHRRLATYLSRASQSSDSRTGSFQ